MTITEELHKGEKIEEQITPHPIAFLWYYILGVFVSLTLFGLIIGIPVIIITELVRRGNKYYITNKRLIHEFVFISKKTSSTIYDKVQDFHVSQGLIERLFGIGTIHINTAGTHNIEIKFKGVKNPTSVKKMIEKHIIQKR